MPDGYIHNSLADKTALDVNTTCTYKNVCPASSSRIRNTGTHLLYDEEFASTKLIFVWSLKQRDKMWKFLVIISAMLIGGAICVFHEDHDHSSRFHDPSIVRDKDHIKQHMGEEEDLSKLSDEELEFRLFKLHDFDNNTKLDGLEIFSAIAHAIPWEPDPDELKGKTRFEIEEEHTVYYTEIVDEILRTDDFNQDGYLSYTEYTMSRRREDDKAKEVIQELAD